MEFDVDAGIIWCVFDYNEFLLESILQRWFFVMVEVEGEKIRHAKQNVILWVRIEELQQKCKWKFTKNEIIINTHKNSLNAKMLKQGMKWEKNA